MNRNGILLSAIALFSLAAGSISAAPAQDLKKQHRPLVAVMPFAFKADNLEYAGIEKGLADALASELVKKKKFRMIERNRIDILLEEIKFQQTGLVDPATAAQIGKQLGAEAYILGSVVSVSARDEWRSVKFAEKTTRWVDVEAEAKLVDVQTGEILASGRAMGKSKTAEKHAFGGKVGELASVKSMSQKALQNLTENLARDLVKTYLAK
jgi:curli biogenesis system outer membrane secretion channel CsgG